MELKRVDAQEAKRLMDEEGYVLLDVRSMPEFVEGHAKGAHNIPFMHKTPQGMVANPDFVNVVKATFPEPAQKLITMCGMGARSARAAAALADLGYTDVVDMKGGFSSEKDDDGNTVNAGWLEQALPTDTGEPSGRSYRDLSQGARPDASPPAAPAPAPAEAAETINAPDAEGMNRFASAKRRVQCARLGRELPGLKRRPYPGDLGERIFREISAAAWDEWVEHSKMIINEYRINSSDPEAMKLLMEQCEQFLYGSGDFKRPEGYVPQ